MIQVYTIKYSMKIIVKASCFSYVTIRDVYSSSDMYLETLNSSLRYNYEFTILMLKASGERL